MFAATSLRKLICLHTDSSAKHNASLSNARTETSLPASLREAAIHIVQGDCLTAREILKGVIADNVDNAEIYNLFGISFERDGDRLKASRFYRVSYYMDQSFKPAADNLCRVCKFYHNQDIRAIAWGIDMREVIK